MRFARLRDLGTLLGVWIAAIVISLPLTWKHFYSQLFLGARLRRDIGFSDSSPYTVDPNFSFRQREVVAVSSVTKGGIAERVGLRPHDVFVEYCRRDRGSTALFFDL